MRGEAVARLVGSKRIQPYHITIARPKGSVLCEDGVRRNGHSLPFMPKSLADEFHPGGNSLCYTIQTAHLMGCDPIYALGFTLQSGSRYFWGDTTNPVLRRSSIYDERRALEWLSWYQKQWPGRVQLVEGWRGPVYDVFDEVKCDEFGPAGQGSQQQRAGGAERDAESCGAERDEGAWLL